MWVEFQPAHRISILCKFHLDLFNFYIYVIFFICQKWVSWNINENKLFKYVYIHILYIIDKNFIFKDLYPQIKQFVKINNYFIIILILKMIYINNYSISKIKCF